MADKNRRKYTKEFKEEAVQLPNTSGKNGHELEKELGQEGKRAFPGNGIPRDEELAQLRKENAVLREERDILRKAVAIFSKSPR